MKIKIRTAFFALLGITGSIALIAQDHTTVRSIELNGSDTRSYIVNDYGKLLPGFTFNSATQGSFFLRANPNSSIPSVDQNFVRTEVVTVEGITTDVGVGNLTTAQKTTSFDYVDGLGRKRQTVVKQGSPLQNDLITSYAYDAYGRSPSDYLPYSSSQATGGYRPGWLAEQDDFYSATPKVAHDDKPYSLKVFDDSPLNEVRESYGPGDAWQTALKSSKSQLKINVIDEAFQWNYINDVTPPSFVPYPAGTLLVQESRDEQDIIAREYKDFRGLAVLSVRDAGNGAYKTYNIYDQAGRLRIVIPPQAVSLIETADLNYKTATLSDQTAFINRWCFQYVYDEFGRLTKKKSPGMDDWALMVYDRWDRLVLTREPGWATNEWTFTKYDDLNRPILTGIYTSSASQSTLQTTASASTARFETLPANAHLYTLGATFPSASESDLRTVTYYDNYNFNISGWDAESNNFNYLPETGFPATAFLTVKGQTTGTKVRVLNTNRWLNTITYYDNKYRTIQTIGENYYDGVDRITNLYDFVKLKQTLLVHSSSVQAPLSILKTFDYDKGGRLLTVAQKTGSSSPVILISNKYNEVGQLIEKNLHSEDAGNTFLQSVDYQYNIRGGVTNINNSTLTAAGNNDDTNDVFGMDMVYNDSETINGTLKTGLYNGNISAIRWKTNNLKDPATEKIFGFNYDGLNRLRTTTYAEKSVSGWNVASDMFTENMNYDKNGNISGLTRNTRLGINSTSPTQVDNLAYKYGDLTAIDNGGNRLTNVHDGTSYYNIADKNQAYGFSELVHNNSLREYVYDASGRLIEDDNREITSISYNYLNMPDLIQLTNNRRVEYTYDAVGNKLRSIIRQDGEIIYQTDYVGSFFYVNGQLSFISTDEGRVIKNTVGVFEYEYFLKDHQDNTRVVFGSKKETKSYLTTIETELAAQEKYNVSTNPDGFRNIPNTPAQLYNHTPASANVNGPNESAPTLGSIGPAKMLQVSAGDRVQLEAFARYTQLPSNPSSLVTGLTSLLIGSFGLNVGEAAYNGFTSYAPGQLATIPGSGTVSKSYLCYILFNSSHTAVTQFGVQAITTTAGTQHERLFINAVMPSSGFVYAFVANENTTASVYFDDFQIVHEKNNNALQVLQSSDYYPFGLSFNEYYQERVKNPDNSYYPQNKFQFQGQERVTGFDMGWYQYKYRMHDPAIGRFGMVDPLSDKYTYNSTYAFSENRLIDGVELEGKEFFSNDTPISIHMYAFGIGGIGTYAYDGLMYAFPEMIMGRNDFRQNYSERNNSQGIYSDENMGDDTKSYISAIRSADAATRSVKGLNTYMSYPTFAASMYFGGPASSAVVKSLYGGSVNMSKSLWYSRNVFSNVAQKYLLDPQKTTWAMKSFEAAGDFLNQAALYGPENVNYTSVVTTQVFGLNSPAATLLSPISIKPFAPNNGGSYSTYGTLSGNLDLLSGTASFSTQSFINSRVKGPSVLPFAVKVGTDLVFGGVSRAQTR